MVVLSAYCLIGAHPGFVFKTGGEHLTSDEWVAEKGLKTERNSSGPSPDEATRV
jgi:hypothetical protein